MNQTCPKCGTHEAPRRAHRHFMEYVLSIVKVFPYRCYSCDARFYRIARRHQPAIVRGSTHQPKS